MLDEIAGALASIAEATHSATWAEEIARAAAENSGVADRVVWIESTVTGVEVLVNIHQMVFARRRSLAQGRVRAWNPNREPWADYLAAAGPDLYRDIAAKLEGWRHPQ